MSWLFSQALVEAFSADTCSDGEPSAQLNVMPTPQLFWRNDKPMEFSRFSRFGLTSRLLTADRGVELLTWFLAGFPVRTSVLPEAAQESTESAPDSGKNSHGWFAKFDRDSSTWKTAQCSLVEDLELFSETWPRSGSMRNGACYQRPMLEPSICASASGLSERFPTPIRNDAEKRGNFDPIRNYGLAGHVKLWPTPNASDNRDRGNLSDPCVQRRIAIGKQVGLSMVVSTESGRLNPEFCEWLMGWPIGWTALEPLAMDKWHEWRHQHSPNCLSEVDAA